ncbi:MAG TPA: hypothetical protein VHE80_06655 [Acidimicrobiales bacterium]|nr:hypothetical protein [Acidimicrobiales bacterium]
MSPASEAAEGPGPAEGAPPPPSGRPGAPAEAPQSDLEAWAERMRRLREGG